MTTGFSPMTGEDVEDIIEANGGLGEWETPNAGKIERWLFPKFIPKCTNRKCKNVAHNLSLNPEAEDDPTKPEYLCGTCKRGFNMNEADKYLSRSGLGPFDTDVETVAAWLDAPRNRVGGIMLLGHPGSGKTSLAQAACTHADREYEVLTATPDHTKDSLLKHFVGDGNGECPLHHDHGDGSECTMSAFIKAVLGRCAEQGKVLIVDEFWLFVDGTKPVFYPALDGNHWLPEAHIDGSALEIHPDFRVIVTANPQVRGASLPEPIGSRFAGTTLHVETSADMLRDLDIDESIVSAWEALKTANLWTPQIREMRAADYWLPTNPAQAASAFLPEHCPESDREQIRNTVVSFLGGHLPGGSNNPYTGRLVVS